MASASGLSRAAAWHLAILGIYALVGAVGARAESDKLSVKLSCTGSYTLTVLDVASTYDETFTVDIVDGNATTTWFGGGESTTITDDEIVISKMDETTGENKSITINRFNGVAKMTDDYYTKYDEFRCEDVTSKKF